MTPEERELLNKSVTLAEENNTMLRAMRRSQRMASIMRGIYWGFLILSAIGAYYFIQPYLGPLLDVYEGGTGDVFQGLQ